MIVCTVSVDGRRACGMFVVCEARFSGCTFLIDQLVVVWDWSQMSRLAPQRRTFCVVRISILIHHRRVFILFSDRSNYSVHALCGATFMKQIGHYLSNTGRRFVVYTPHVHASVKRYYESVLRCGDRCRCTRIQDLVRERSPRRPSTAFALRRRCNIGAAEVCASRHSFICLYVVASAFKVQNVIKFSLLKVIATRLSTPAYDYWENWKQRES